MAGDGVGLTEIFIFALCDIADLIFVTLQLQLLILSVMTFFFFTFFFKYSVWIIHSLV